jgi:hypothetical protein
VSDDGSVVVAGADDEKFSFHCSGTATVVERLTPDGFRDRGFGDAGDVRFSYPGQSETAAVDVLIDDRGRITVAGYATKGA